MGGKYGRPYDSPEVCAELVADLTYMADVLDELHVETTYQLRHAIQILNAIAKGERP